MEIVWRRMIQGNFEGRNDKIADESMWTWGTTLRFLTGTAINGGHH